MCRGRQSNAAQRTVLSVSGGLRLIPVGYCLEVGVQVVRLVASAHMVG